MEPLRSIGLLGPACPALLTERSHRLAARHAGNPHRVWFLRQVEDDRHPPRSTERAFQPVLKARDGEGSTPGPDQRMKVQFRFPQTAAFAAPATRGTSNHFN